MKFAVSTNGNSCDHDDGVTLVEAVRGLGLDTIELGYALTHRQAEDIARLRREGRIQVCSVHAYCPVPMGAFEGHPEIFSICNPSQRDRHRAIEAVLESARLAAEMEAHAVVLHAGRVPVRRHWVKLHGLAKAGRRHSPAYERVMARLMKARDRHAPKVLALLRESLAELLPHFERLGVKLGLENLPSWDAAPNESEMQQLCNEFAGSALGYWHDFGHAQVRENMGFIQQAGVVRRIAPRLVGVHIQDIVDFADEHLMPPHGSVNFQSFKGLIPSGTPLVLEPAVGTPAAHLRDAVDFLRSIWA
jgi:sugar phosphate isomerase/epimerase